MTASIIIAAHNAEDWIGRAIRSCLDQSTPAEVIVVDDASTDHTRLVAQDHQVNLIPLTPHRGLPAAANRGIRAAQHQYVIRVDADDYIHTDLIRILTLYLDTHPEQGAVACDYQQINTNSSTYQNWWTNPIACGVMFRKDHLVQLGLYDESFQVGGEWLDLQLRFEERWPIGHVPIPLYRYRFHGKNMTVTKPREHAADLERARSKNRRVVA